MLNLKKPEVRQNLGNKNGAEVLKIIMEQKAAKQETPASEQENKEEKKVGTSNEETAKSNKKTD